MTEKIWRVEWSRVVGPFGQGLTFFSEPLTFGEAWRECLRVLREEEMRVPCSHVAMLDDSLPYYRVEVSA